MDNKDAVVVVDPEGAGQGQDREDVGLVQVRELEDADRGWALGRVLGRDADQDLA